MEQIKNSLRSLTRAICAQLDGVQIPKRPVWTVVNPPDAAPHVALDVDRPALSDLRLSLTIGLLQMPGYGAAAEAIEDDSELKNGIIVDAGGFLHEPERTNLTQSPRFV